MDEGYPSSCDLKQEQSTAKEKRRQENSSSRASLRAGFEERKVPRIGLTVESW